MADKALCSIPDCGKRVKSGRLCGMHYQRDYRANRQHLKKVRCSVQGCNRPSIGHKLCSTHYQRWRVHGDSFDASVIKPPSGLDLIEQAITEASADKCWHWPKYRNASGYGVLRSNGRVQLAHRVVCTKVHGDPPTPLHQAAHSCGRGNEGCINWHHLRWATGDENMKDTVLHGTSLKGTRNPNAILTEADIPVIRQMLKEGRLQKDVAKIFGVHKTTICNISTGRKWGHL